MGHYHPHSSALTPTLTRRSETMQLVCIRIDGTIFLCGGHIVFLWSNIGVLDIRLQNVQICEGKEFKDESCHDVSGEALKLPV